MTSKLVPIGREVRRTEAYHHGRRMQRGGGWSDREREDFKRWESEARAERWIVKEHLPPNSEHNKSAGWAYLLVAPDNAQRVSYSLPYNWEENVQ